MRTYLGTIQGPVLINEDATIEGVVIGDVLIAAPAKVALKGLVTGDFIIEPCAAARVQGRVRGILTKLGGEVVVLGGSVAGTGSTQVAFGALVTGRAPRSSDDQG